MGYFEDYINLIQRLTFLTRVMLANMKQIHTCKNIDIQVFRVINNHIQLHVVEFIINNEYKSYIYVKQQTM